MIRKALAIPPHRRTGTLRDVEHIVELRNTGEHPCTFVLSANTYFFGGPDRILVLPRRNRLERLSLRKSAHWYDFTAKVDGLANYSRRFAGHMETGRHSFSDPAMCGLAIGDRT